MGEKHTSDAIVVAIIIIIDVTFIIVMNYHFITNALKINSVNLLKG